MTKTAERRPRTAADGRKSSDLPMITILNIRFATFELMSFCELIMKIFEKNQNIMNDVQNIAHNIDEQIAYQRCAIKSKKKFLS